MVVALQQVDLCFRFVSFWQILFPEDGSFLRRETLKRSIYHMSIRFNQSDTQLFIFVGSFDMCAS